MIRGQIGGPALRWPVAPIASGPLTIVGRRSQPDPTRPTRDYKCRAVSHLSRKRDTGAADLCVGRSSPPWERLAYYCFSADLCSGRVNRGAAPVNHWVRSETSSLSEPEPIKQRTRNTRVIVAENGDPRLSFNWSNRTNEGCPNALLGTTYVNLFWVRTEYADLLHGVWRFAA